MLNMGGEALFNSLMPPPGDPSHALITAIWSLGSHMAAPSSTHCTSQTLHYEGISYSIKCAHPSTPWYILQRCYFKVQHSHVSGVGSQTVRGSRMPYPVYVYIWCQCVNCAVTSFSQLSLSRVSYTPCHVCMSTSKTLHTWKPICTKHACWNQAITFVFLISVQRRHFVSDAAT